MTANIGLHAVAETTSQFSNKFLNVVAKQTPGNLISSPLSAQVVLAMAAYGARGKTATEIRSCLSIPSEDELGLNGYRSLIEILNASKGVELRLANKIYVASRFEVKNAFKELTANKFLSSSEEVDFNDSLTASKKINTWCENQTNKRIKELISSDSVDSDTKLVLVNAVYFKGQWETKFNPSMTLDRPFHIDEKTAKHVPTMFIKNKFRTGHLEELNARFIELPYQGDDLSMFIILPNDINGLTTVENNLHKVKLGQCLQQAFPSDVELFLPKFKIESTLDLEKSLRELGMGEMFEKDADFSGITETPLYVSKVIQKAFIEVNEEGSEAAAATGMILQARCMVFSDEMIIDHPFIYMIVSSTPGVGNGDVDIVPLFTGHVTDPSL